ncbi:MAG: adenosylcobalamin-dependent ribonucleoside-diphosphate reductase, partial [Saprospiraceae bacterium]
PWRRATAEELDWISKVQLQGRVQKWVDHSISATVNLPENAPEALVETIFRTAWETGCKGVTVFREGARWGVLSSRRIRGGRRKRGAD